MYQCCFCGQAMDGSDPQTLTGVVAAASRVDEADRPAQQLWFHAACLGARLASDVVFDPEDFGE